MRTEFENKLLVLLSLETIGFMTENELLELLGREALINYFDLALTLNTLVEDQSVLREEIYYSISKKGKEELDMFASKLPLSVRNTILINAPEIIVKFNKDRDVVVFYSKEQDFQKVNIYMNVDGLMFFKAHLQFLQNTQIKNIQKLASQNREKVFSVISSMAQDPTNATNYNGTMEGIELFMENGFHYLKVIHNYANISWDLCFLITDNSKLENYIHNWTQSSESYLKEIKSFLLG